MQVFRRLVTFSVVPTNLRMFSSLDAQLEMAHRSLFLCIQLCWKSRIEVMASSVVPAQLDTKAAGIPVAQVSVWENHWTVFLHAKTLGVSHHHMEKHLPQILPGDWIHKQCSNMKPLHIRNSWLLSGELSAFTSSPQRGTGVRLMVLSAPVCCLPHQC